MPPPPPQTYATLTSPLSGPVPRPYILNILPSPSSPHLILHHPSTSITIADAQSLQAIDRLGDPNGSGEGHSGVITCVRTGGQGSGIWSSGKDASVVRWDERSRRAANVIKAFVRKPLPVTALAVSDKDNLLIGGTELVSSEAHILFWDTRNTKSPAYTHTSTHSDDITHLSILPPTRTFLPATSTPTSSTQLPSNLLLSASTDGLVALSNLLESDEDEALIAAENWNQSVAGAGSYVARDGKMRVWGRSDMDGVAVWEVGLGEGEGGDVELKDFTEYDSTQFKYRKFNKPQTGPMTVHAASEETAEKTQLQSDYLIDVCPSLGISKSGAPAVAVGSNDGDIVLLHSAGVAPSAFFLTDPTLSRGHKDVIRCLYHDHANEAVYTGSEDGVLSGWSLSSLPRLLVGDKELDDDGGDGRENENENEQDEDEESEIETDDDDEVDEDNMDDDEMEVDQRPRYGEVLGGGKKRTERSGIRDKRRRKRYGPY